MLRVAAVALLFVSLSGCAGSEGANPTMDDEVVPAGTLRGVVVDESIIPLAGASIHVAPGELRNTTDTEGRFEFTDLDVGVYTIHVSMPGYVNETLVATVSHSSNEAVKIIMPIDAGAVPFVVAYKYKGLVECAVFPINWCAQVNIASIILCEGYSVCLGNITTDRSLALHWLDGVPDFLQTEMVWRASNTMGENFYFVIGGATREEIASGIVSAQNTTRGPSPLMMQLHTEVLDEMAIGADRALMTQVHPSPQEEIPGGCVIYDPCGPSVHFMQNYEFFTHAFFGYEPPEDWLFAEDGAPPPA